MRPADAIQWMVGSLVIPNGEGEGGPFRPLQWQKRVLKALLEGEQRIVIVTCPRAQGKTSWAAACLALALSTDAFGLNSKIIVVSPRRNQSSVTLDQVSAMLQIPPRGRHPDYSKSKYGEVYRIRSRETGNEIEVRTDQHDAGQGAIPAFTYIDELGFLSDPSGTLDSYRQALGKLRQGRLLAAGTKPAPDPDNPFTKMITNPPRDTKVFSWGHDNEDTALTMRAVERCSPSLSAFPYLKKVIKDELVRARADETEAIAFKVYRLNMSLALVDSVVVSPEAWAKVEGDLPDPDGPLVYGVDLAGGDSFSSVVGYWPMTGRLEGLLACTAGRSIEDRDKHDRAGGWYTRMHGRGELFEFDTHDTDVDRLLEESINRFGYPDSVVGDRYKSHALTDACLALGIPEPEIVRMMPLEKAELLSTFRAAVGDKRVAVLKSELWRRSLANARVEAGSGAASKLEMLTRNKSRRQRDDLVAAALLAVGRRQEVEEGLILEPGLLTPMTDVLEPMSAF